MKEQILFQTIQEFYEKICEEYKNNKLNKNSSSEIGRELQQEISKLKFNEDNIIKYIIDAQHKIKQNVI